MESKSHLFDNVVFSGAPIEEATAAAIFVHGRGDASNGMQQLASQLVQNPNVALAFPKATNATWYPYSFMRPKSENQPWLDSALENLGKVVAHFTDAGIPADKIFLLGFSQGACLSLEYASRNAQRYAGVAVLSGGVIGEKVDPSIYSGNFEGTPIFIGCSDVDFHIPVERVHASANVAADLGADVDKRIYPNEGHVINQDEFQKLIEMFSGLGK